MAKRAFGKRTRMQLTGWREMQRTLQQLPDELQPRLVTEALMQAAEPMRDEAIANAPDAEPFGEGLSANIIISDKVTDTQKRDVPMPEKDKVTVFVGVDGERPGIAPHGILVEFGTGPRYHESGKYVGEMPAQPFLRPAFDATARQVILRFGGRLKRIIEGAARTLARRNG